jgi:hypothetical protein
MEDENKILQKRPFFLSALCVGVFVYTISMTFFFLSGIVFSKWINGVLDDFLTRKDLSGNVILYIGIGGFALYSISLLGIILIWKLKRTGFYLFAISTVFIVLLPFIFGFGSYISTLINLLVIILLGSFYNKYH